MRRNTNHQKASAEKVVKDIRRATRRQFGAEEKIRIVLEGLRGEDSIAELCRREGINQNLYYRWSKDFLEAGKKRLAGDTAREATSDEVRHLRSEALALKEAVADLTLDNRLLKKRELYSKVTFCCHSGASRRMLKGRKNALRIVFNDASGMSYSRSISALLGWKSLPGSVIVRGFGSLNRRFRLLASLVMS